MLLPLIEHTSRKMPPKKENMSEMLSIAAKSLTLQTMPTIKSTLKRLARKAIA